MTADDSKVCHRPNHVGKFQSTHLKGWHSGWSNGNQQEHDIGKERKEKLGSIKGGKNFQMVSLFYLAAV